MKGIPEPAVGSVVKWRHPEGEIVGSTIWPTGDSGLTWFGFCSGKIIIGIAPPEAFIAPAPPEPMLGRVVMWNRKDGGFLCMRRGITHWEAYGEAWHWEGILLDAIPGTLQLVMDAEVIA